MKKVLRGQPKYIPLGEKEVRRLGLPTATVVGTVCLHSRIFPALIATGYYAHVERVAAVIGITNLNLY